MPYRDTNKHTYSENYLNNIHIALAFEKVLFILGLQEI